MIAKLLISPSLTDRVEEIAKILTALPGEGKLNHPDVLYFKDQDKLGIKEARAIKEHFSTKPYQLPGKILIVENASSLSMDAQNALLKTLEEPPSEATLILGARSENDLLPTILSRCQIVQIPLSHPGEAQSASIGSKPSPDSISRSSTSLQNDIEKLITSSLEERFEYVEKQKDKHELLNALIEYFHQQLLKNPTKETADFTKELLEAEKWAKSNVNIRGILEYLMLIIPSL
jgi:DNA polymerase III subunit delta'